MLKLFLDATDDIPWESLNFVTGIINYGGRVTDDQDSRCIMTILEKFCNPKCLDETYKFTPSGTYFAPAEGKIEVYRDYVESLPMHDLPEIFGLHENANLTYQRSESNRIISTLLSIQPRLATVAGGMTPDEIVLEKCKEFLDQLPQLLEKKEGLKELFIEDAQGLIPSLSTVLVQEMEKFNNMLVVMKKSLIEIDLAIKGFIVMSETLDSMYLAVLNNQVPKNWMDVAYPSLKLLSVWYPDLIERVATMDRWLKDGNPASYWLPGMFFPQGFMTGVL
jgi:dynein heavy chain